MAHDPLVSTEWLADHLGRSDIRILDGTLGMTGDPRPGFLATHLPGAQFFDISEISDRSDPLPHMQPSPEDFARAASALGVGNDDTVVVYDQQGLFSAARVWWSFRLFGHDDVRVLDGGLPKWVKEGRAVESGTPAAPALGRFTPRRRPELVRNLDQVRHALNAKVQVLDARPPQRFRGEISEPRPGMRPGHMPGAVNTPYAALLNSDGTMRSHEGLEMMLSILGADPRKPTITTCGSGVTAGIVALALARLGQWDAAVYDGSWTEWGSRGDTPVVTGS